jgi:hypothetical protein
MTRFNQFGGPIIELSMTEDVAEGLVSLLNDHPNDQGFAALARSLQTVLDRDRDEDGVDDEFHIETSAI